MTAIPDPVDASGMLSHGMLGSTLVLEAAMWEEQT